MLTPVANTTFSALILLKRYALNVLQFEVWRRLYVKQQEGHQVRPHDYFKLLNELNPEFGHLQRFSGTVRVTVIENRHARLPFPNDLFRGPFDQRWGWKEGCCGPVWIGATLDELYNDGVPFYML